MTPFAAAYDNIRLIRRKIEIAETTIGAAKTCGERDIARAALLELQARLSQATMDFADAGFEERLARLIDAAGPA